MCKKYYLAVDLVSWAGERMAQEVVVRIIWYLVVDQDPNNLLSNPFEVPKTDK